MFLGITGFEIRYQLKNPVFWVAIAFFFLMGFGITASENVSIGTPGAVHENAPYAIAVATGALALFYLFVITAFVANAIVRDDSSGFAPIVRATPVELLQLEQAQYRLLRPAHDFHFAPERPPKRRRRPPCPGGGNWL